MRHVLGLLRNISIFILPVPARPLFFVFLVAFVAVEISISHFLDELTSYQELRIFQAHAVMAFGLASFSYGEAKERYAIDVLLLWSAWIFLSDFLPYIPPLVASLEATAFTVLLSWVYLRPYDYMATYSLSGNVHIAFYGGRNAPYLSRLASNFGFPFSSVALIAGEIAVRPSKSRGCMVETNPDLLDKRGYVFVDTGVPVTHDIKLAMMSVAGTPTGYGFLRFKCLKNLKPVLELMGDEWLPKTYLNVPSIYYRQCIEESNKYMRAYRKAVGDE